MVREPRVVPFVATAIRRTFLNSARSILLSCVLILASINQPGWADDTWSKFRHDLENTGYTSWTAPETDSLSWMDALGHDVEMCSSPTVANDFVYMGAFDNKIYCLNAFTGAKKWEFTTGGDVCSTPAVAGPEGEAKVYVGSYDGNVYCLTADGGVLVWSHPIGNDYGDYIDSSPAVTLDEYGQPDRVYIGSTNGNVYCLDAQGNGGGTTNQIWVFTTNYDHVYSSPAVWDDYVYVGAGSDQVADSGAVFCLRVQGNGTTTTVRWKVRTPGNWVWSSPAVVNNGVFIASATRVYRFNALTGELDWIYYDYDHPDNVFVSSPAVAYGKVYIGSRDDAVYCLNATGTVEHTTNLIWRYETTGGVDSSPAVADGKVFVGEGYFASLGNNLYCLNAEGNNDSLKTTDLIWSRDVCSSLRHYSPAVAYGKVYTGVNCGSYKLAAFGPPAACDVSPTELDFPVVVVGNHVDKDFAITNTGTEIASGIVSESCDHFSIISGGGVYNLDPGEQLNVTVRFEPTSAGSLACTIETGNLLCGNVSCTGVGESIIPTVSEWGLIITVLLLTTAGSIVFRRRSLAARRR